jgi:dynein heavy chain 1
LPLIHIISTLLSGDEAFDFGAMGRIFCGLCQVGAWGCFDEFNRLEERILSAVSQHILTIQQGLLERQRISSYWANLSVYMRM